LPWPSSSKRETSRESESSFFSQEWDGRRERREQNSTGYSNVRKAQVGEKGLPRLWTRVTLWGDTRTCGHDLRGCRANAGEGSNPSRKIFLGFTIIETIHRGDYGDKWFAGYHEGEEIEKEISAYNGEKSGRELLAERRKKSKRLDSS